MLFHKDFKIYIIGYIPSVITLEVKRKFENARKELEKLNVIVFNPLDNLSNERMSKTSAIRNNIYQLCISNAIYVLNEEGINSLAIPELRLAIQLDLIVMQQTYSITNIEKPQKNDVVTNRLSKHKKN